VIQDAGGSVSNIQENAEQRTMFGIGTDAPSERLGVFERRKRTIDSANDFPKRDFLRRPFELVAAVGAAQTRDDSRAFEIQENGLEELLRQLLLGSNILDLDDAGRMLCKNRQRLQRVKPSL